MPPLRVDDNFAALRVSIERLLDEHFFTSRIQALVDLRIADKLPSLTERYIDHALPGLVAKQIMDQVPKYLDQNSVMRDILNNHKKSLDQELNNTARLTLSRLANESQYHDVRQAYVRAMDERFRAQLDAQDQKFRDNMTSRMALLDHMERRMDHLEFWGKVSSVATIGLAGGLLFSVWSRR